MLDSALFDAARHPVCFALSTKDRPGLTLEAIGGLVGARGFDLLWFDGSRTEAGRSLPHQLAPDLTPLREIHVGITGGPDFAIFPALARMLALGYPYCGLIENDVLLAPGWLDTLMGLFEAGRADGLEVGAVSPYGFADWVLFRRPRYAVTRISGATAVLFTREAAQLVLDQYRTTTAAEIAAWTSRLAGGAETDPHDTRVSSDLNYNVVLHRHGLAVLGAVPRCARLLDSEDLLYAGLGGYCEDDRAPPASEVDDRFGGFVATLRALSGQRARQGFGAGSPHLFMGSLGCWTLFPHQLLYAPGSAASLRGRWRFVWEKFDGPFAIETDEPGAALVLPLSGRVRGVFCAHGPDAAAFVLQQGDTTLARCDPRRPDGAMKQYLAQLDIAPRGTEPVELRIDGAPGTRLRIGGLCLDAVPPWLPATGGLDVAALCGVIEACGRGEAIPPR